MQLHGSTDSTAKEIWGLRVTPHEGCLNCEKFSTFDWNRPSFCGCTGKVMNTIWHLKSQIIFLQKCAYTLLLSFSPASVQTVPGHIHQNDHSSCHSEHWSHSWQLKSVGDLAVVQASPCPFSSCWWNAPTGLANNMTEEHDREKSGKRKTTESNHCSYVNVRYQTIVLKTQGTFLP